MYKKQGIGKSVAEALNQYGKYANIKMCIAITPETLQEEMVDVELSHQFPSKTEHALRTKLPGGSVNGDVYLCTYSRPY